MAASEVRADIQALQIFREAVARFAMQDGEVVLNGYHEIELTLATLDDAERHWRYEIDRRSEALEMCYREAATAAEEGYYVDCRPYEEALRQAEANLENILGWKRVVLDAASSYRRVAERYRQVLDSELPRACRFLDDRVSALESYYHTRVSTGAGSASRLSGAAVAAGMLGIVQRSQGSMTRSFGNTGTEVASHILSGKFGLEALPHAAGRHGFAQVYRAPGMSLLALVPGRAGAASSGWVPSGSYPNTQIEALLRDLGLAAIGMVILLTDVAAGIGAIFRRSSSGTWEKVVSDADLDDLLGNEQDSGGGM